MVATLKLKDARDSRRKAPSTSAKANWSKRSDKSRSQSTAKSSVRAKAFAELATAKEQAQFDLLLAEKEKSRKEREAQEELRKATETAKYEHDVAVLKAKKLEAVASTKLDAIEQSVEGEDLLTRTSSFKLKHENPSERTRAWISDQEQIVMSGDTEIDKKQIHVKEPGLDKEITNPRHQSPILPGKTNKFQENKFKSFEVDIEHCFNEISATNERLVESLARQNLPKCHPDVFNGDATMFHPWKRAFKAMIRDTGISPEQELNYLYKYTTGDPRRLLDSFRKRQYRKPETLLKKTWNEMESRFGNTAAISRSLLEQLVEKAKFDENDRKRLQEFSDLCMDVTSQLELLPGLACLNYPIAIRPIVERLPTSLQRKWEKEVVTYPIDNDDDYY